MAVLLLPLFMTAVFAGNTCYRHTFQRFITQDDLAANEVASDVFPTQHLTSCAQRCAEDEKCVALTYHGDQCSIYRSSLSSSGIPGSRSYIKQGALPNADPCPVSQGYTSVLYPRFCFKLYNTDPWKNWADSQARCQSENGRLIILNTTEKHDYITAFMTKASSTYGALIGLQVTSSTDFAWTDGSTFLRAGSNGYGGFSSGCAYLVEEKVKTTTCSNAGWSLCEIV
ncbi:C-type lectin domain family 9 member A-like [Haliotis cracherodii]|uniref:C-type lectin domain family 9 member A-like n=1 Tax=Haliotis cracherodii TaxID=6455 RepID=UPI0039E98AD0